MTGAVHRSSHWASFQLRRQCHLDEWTYQECESCRGLTITTGAPVGTGDHYFISNGCLIAHHRVIIRLTTNVQLVSAPLDSISYFLQEFLIAILL